MQFFKQVKDLQHFLEKAKAEKLSVGFVPTMGALHPGHISLIDKAKLENDIVVCSIFVNPTQFNDKSDLENYPRPLENDIQLLIKSGCDILFNPEVEEVFPDFYVHPSIAAKNLTPITKPNILTHDNKDLFRHDENIFSTIEKSRKENYIEPDSIDLNGLDSVMEGKFRPGHFKGVVKVVSRLFDIVKPHRAYFGEKDFQQMAVIKQMVKHLKLDVKIVPCPIMREKNGLAMSSRNLLLTGEEKDLAAIISKTLFEAKALANNSTVSEVKEFVEKKINSISAMRLEYFEIVNSETLSPAKNWENSAQNVGCIALFLGKVRLIDNIIF